jgi:flagellin
MPKSTCGNKAWRQVADVLCERKRVPQDKRNEPRKVSGTHPKIGTKGEQAMALSVLNNIASLAAQNQLTITNSNLQKALFQLSSGSRINTGADDAAGLAIADGLHGNITALTQSARNANDGVGELQVADGSLAQVTTLLNRSITLATESATGTVSDTQRVALDAEYTAIKAEIDRIGAKTNYNATPVFTANTLNIFLSDGGAASNSTIGVTTGLLSAAGLGLGGDSTATLSATANAAAADTVKVGSTTYKFVAALTGVANEVLLGGTLQATLSNLANAVNGGAGAGTTYGVGTAANASASAVAGPTSVVFTARLAGVGAAGQETGNFIDSVVTVAAANTFSFINGALFTGGSGTTNDLLTSADATAALATINSAIQTVAGLRGTIGASVNRLQSASNVISNQTQNLTGAEDGVRAADIPSTVATLAKYSILEQTGISALAQANQQQQLVLKLLQ